MPSKMKLGRAYHALALGPEASLNDVKKSYRNLALKHHPDKNPGNEEEARLHFVEIGTAYELLTEHLKKWEADAASRARPADGRPTTEGDAGSFYADGFEGSGWRWTETTTKKYQTPLQRLTTAALKCDVAMSAAAKAFHKVIGVALRAEGLTAEARYWSFLTPHAGLKTDRTKLRDPFADASTDDVPRGSLSEGLKFIMRTMYATYTGKEAAIVQKINDVPGDLDDTTDLSPFLDARAALVHKWEGVRTLLKTVLKVAEKKLEGSSGWSEANRRKQLDWLAAGFERLETEEARRVLWSLARLDWLDA